MTTGTTQRMPLGHCVFGTWEGLTIRGTGCFSAPPPALMHVLDFGTQKKMGRNEELWFVIPASSGGVPVKIVGQVRFSRDYKQRDGFLGAAVAVSDKSLLAAGFSGSIYTVGHLYETFRHLCVAADSGAVNFANTADVLNRFQTEGANPIEIADIEPLRMRLPKDWYSFISLPELFRVIPFNPEFVASGTRGFLLRDHDAPEVDHDLSQKFLSNWAEKVFGPKERLEFEQHLDKTHRAYTVEKRRADDLVRRIDALSVEQTRQKTALTNQLEAQSRLVAEARGQLRAATEGLDNARAEFERKDSEWVRKYKSKTELTERLEKTASEQTKQVDLLRLQLSDLRKDVAGRDEQGRLMKVRADSAETKVKSYEAEFARAQEVFRQVTDELVEARGQRDAFEKDYFDLARHQTRHQSDSQDSKTRTSIAPGRSIPVIVPTVPDIAYEDTTYHRGARSRKWASGAIRRSTGSAAAVPALDQYSVRKWPTKRKLATNVATSAVLISLGAVAAANIGSVFPGVRLNGVLSRDGSAMATNTIEDLRRSFVATKSEWIGLKNAPNDQAFIKLGKKLDNSFTAIENRISMLDALPCKLTPDLGRVANENKTLANENQRLSSENQRLVSDAIKAQSVKIASSSETITPLLKAWTALSTLRRVPACPPGNPAPGAAQSATAGPVPSLPTGAGAGAVVASSAGGTATVVVVDPRAGTAPTATPATPDVAPPAAGTGGNATTAVAPVAFTFVKANQVARDKAEATLQKCQPPAIPKGDKGKFISYGFHLESCYRKKDPDWKPMCDHYEVEGFMKRTKIFKECAVLSKSVCGAAAADLPGADAAKFSSDVVIPFAALLQCLVDNSEKF
jgi:hypothetical protein